MRWHTPVEYAADDTARLLKRRRDAAYRYRDMAEQRAGHYFNDDDTLRVDKAQLSRKALKRIKADMEAASDLYDKTIEHFESLTSTLRMAAPLLKETDMDRQAFYEQAMAQTMPDEFTTVLRRNPDQPTDQHAFSIEAMETVGYQLHDFMLARTVAYLAREGRAPKGMRAELRLTWDDEPPTDEQLEQTEMSPWFAATDSGATLPPVDGTHRLSTFLTDRREEK